MAWRGGSRRNRPLCRNPSLAPSRRWSQLRGPAVTGGVSRRFPGTALTARLAAAGTGRRRGGENMLACPSRRLASGTAKHKLTGHLTYSGP